MSNTIIGSITSKQNLTGEISKAFEYLDPITQEKETIPTKETQIITYDKGYTGLSKLTVGPIPDEYIIPTGTVDIITNGYYKVLDYEGAKVEVNPILQDKRITITENGTQNITVDEGYDGLGSVEITANIEGGVIPKNEYVQEGLIGYFDARDDFDSNNHWLNKVGTDYFRQCYPNTPEIIERMKSLKTSDAIVNDGSFSMINTVDYCKSGYTFELVGMEKDGNTDFLTFDRNQTPEICIGKYGTGIFSPINCTNGVNQLETKIAGLTQKRCTMVLHLKKVFNRGVSSGRVILMYSVNGSPWSVWGLRDLTSASSYKTFGTMLMSYYSTGAGGSVCEVNCVRIYNRMLSNEELKHNHEADKINFNLDE